ncbi:helix-turn-helix domain-containing protein [Dactylosporangium sp. NPDC005572]|uniref:helix-turn-helix domain-containing protein n=1 Tax=Dactylosporangium sp. NPDC005572 TaxID=3156889 RepID=UPI0033B228CC
MTPDDVAEMLGTSKKFVYERVRDGDLEHIKLGTSRFAPLRIRESEVMRYLTENTVAAKKAG